ncbi:hypothetical protein Tco_0979907 [Tanacetum coccineum]
MYHHCHLLMYLTPWSRGSTYYVDDASPTAESPGYIADSNSIEEDTDEDSIDYPDKPEDGEEDDDEDPKEDPEEDSSEGRGVKPFIHRRGESFLLRDRQSKHEAVRKKGLQD